VGGGGLPVLEDLHTSSCQPIGGLLHGCCRQQRSPARVVSSCRSFVAGVSCLGQVRTSHARKGTDTQTRVAWLRRTGSGQGPRMADYPDRDGGKAEN
jgi:hypothetical protein